MKLIPYFLSSIFFLSFISLAFASETLLNREQVKKLFSDRTMSVTHVNFKQRGTDDQYTMYTTELGAMHRTKEIDDKSVRGWFTDEFGRFCFSRALSSTYRNPQNTCGQIVWDGQSTYYMYKSINLKQRNDIVANKKRDDLLMIFSNVGKGNHLNE